MQKTIYQCDQCSKEIGANKHISISFSNYSGIAVPPVKGNGWQVKSSLQGRFMHFCNSKCIGAFFAALIKKTI